MGKMMRNLRDGLDRWLYRRGYVHSEVRELVRNQLVLTALICVVCLPFAGISVDAWSLAAGTAIIGIFHDAEVREAVADRLFEVLPHQDAA